MSIEARDVSGEHTKHNNEEAIPPWTNRRELSLEFLIIFQIYTKNQKKKFKIFFIILLFYNFIIF